MVVRHKVLERPILSLNTELLGQITVGDYGVDYGVHGHIQEKRG